MVILKAESEHQNVTMSAFVCNTVTVTVSLSFRLFVGSGLGTGNSLEMHRRTQNPRQTKSMGHPWQLYSRLMRIHFLQKRRRIATKRMAREAKNTRLALHGSAQLMSALIT